MARTAFDSEIKTYRSYILSQILNSQYKNILG